SLFDRLPFFCMHQSPSRSKLFPYTTLFRSIPVDFLEVLPSLDLEYVDSLNFRNGIGSILENIQKEQGLRERRRQGRLARTRATVEQTRKTCSDFRDGLDALGDIAFATLFH